jgi:hypothetical protein
MHVCKGGKEGGKAGRQEGRKEGRVIYFSIVEPHAIYTM